MTITEALKKYSHLEAELLLMHVLKCPKEFLYMHRGESITKEQEAQLARLAHRRDAGEPIAYIVGYKYFYGLKFKVNKNVLIPRPETEWLVERAVQVHSAQFIVHSKKPKTNLRILDMGTGSGSIAIGIAHTLNTKHYALSTRISASDISEKALAVARYNAKTHKTNITYIQSDLFKNVRGKYDLITANLPYVPQGMYELLYHNLRYEPKVAITDGGEVWDIYHRFFTALPKHLTPGGVALMEMDDGAKPAMQAMIKQLLPAYKVKFIKDLGGLWRFMELRAPQ